MGCNRYGHWFIDPDPEDGGAIIVFVNLLLKMLEDLRQADFRCERFVKCDDLHLRCCVQDNGGIIGCVSRVD